MFDGPKSDWKGHSFHMSEMHQTDERLLWNQSVPLWDQKRRGTPRVVMIITMDTTALLLFWAFLELVCKVERRREGVMFVLKVCYINSVIISVIFFNISLFVHPMHPSCAAVVGLIYISVLCSLSWALLTSLQRLLVSRHASPEQVRSHRLALGITVLYLMIGYGIPCVGLITLLTYFYSRDFVARTMCWLSTDAMWWLIMPILFFVGGAYTLAAVAFRQYRETPADVRCFLYTTFLLNVLLSAAILMVQVDLLWPSINKVYVTLLLLITHNVLVWFHMTDAFVECCPCARETEGVTDAYDHPVQQFRHVHTVQPSTDRQSRVQGHDPRRDQSDAEQRRAGQGHNQNSPTTREGDTASNLTSQQHGTDDLDKLSEMSAFIMDDMGACEEQFILLEGFLDGTRGSKTSREGSVASGKVCAKCDRASANSVSAIESPADLNLCTESCRQLDWCQHKKSG